MPTGIWSSRLRSGSAHCDLQLAVEVRQCPLGSGARGGGPAVPTGIWTARRRRRVRRRRRQRRRRRRRTALIKSNNPHLAGGEKHHFLNTSGNVGEKTLLSWHRKMFDMNWGIPSLWGSIISAPNHPDIICCCKTIQFGLYGFV